MKFVGLTNVSLLTSQSKLELSCESVFWSWKRLELELFSGDAGAHVRGARVSALWLFAIASANLRRRLPDVGAGTKDRLLIHRHHNCQLRPNHPVDYPLSVWPLSSGSEKCHSFEIQADQLITPSNHVMYCTLVCLFACVSFLSSFFVWKLR